MGTNNRQFVEINTSQQQIIFISQSGAATRKMLTTIQIRTISNKSPLVVPYALVAARETNHPECRRFEVIF